MKKLLVTMAVCLVACISVHAQDKKTYSYNYQFSSKFSRVLSDGVIKMWDSVIVVFNNELIKADTAVITYYKNSVLVDASKKVVVTANGKETLHDRYTKEYLKQP